ncbi:MAG: polysaccharide biosynthesis tyrosine autokinase [Anaerolineae bacterium]|nr:polysaccharide biosynthesis tyrosine autokinase [Anaerolineae bacterium]
MTVIVIVTSIAVSMVAAAGLLIPPVYGATATVRVLLDVGLTDLVLRDDYNTRLLNTYAKVLTSNPVLEKIILQFPEHADSLTPSNLRHNLEVAVVPDTELITITVHNGDPVLACNIANALSQLLIEYTRELYVGNGRSTRDILEEQLNSLEIELQNDRYALATLNASGSDDAQIEALSRQIEFRENAYNQLLDQYESARLNESLRANSVSIMAPATVSHTPLNTIGFVQIGLGAVIGLFCGVGLAFVLENLDTRIHSVHVVERLLDLPVLGAVPRGLLEPDRYQNNVEDTKAFRHIEEAYRLLTINLLLLREQSPSRPAKTILITSALTREGKSTVAANLAQTLAERGQTVFLVDSDLRRPAQAKIFGQEEHIGINDLLSEPMASVEIGYPFVSEEDGPLSQLICPTDNPCLFVINAGPAVANPAIRLASPSMEQLIKYLGAQGQTTILDAPPVLGMADTSLLAPKVDGVILVVRQGFSSRETVRETLKQLNAAGARVLGVIFVKRGSNGTYH